jgi:hypothetical protein
VNVELDQIQRNPVGIGKAAMRGELRDVDGPNGAMNGDKRRLTIFAGWQFIRYSMEKSCIFFLVVKVRQKIETSMN